ncbi:MAG: hypothetical protein GYB33_00080 [Gammaproteobacteria bacterium]|nr:hypothetical protein [Gammaproteobacteria bacterium]
MSEVKPFFLTPNPGFGQATEKDDLLHPEKNSLVDHDSLTETQYFGFSVPEAGIHALCYMWHRPNMGIVTGGAWVWKGFKDSVVHSELCDLRTYKDTALNNDLHEYRLNNGYGVKILEPLKRFHMTYADPAANNSIDIILQAVSPVVMFADGNHFEQAMHAKGELVLRGERYEVDSYNIRDRSWGKPRPEDNMPLPPTSWMTATFNENFSINCNVFDQVSRAPELQGSKFAFADENTVNGGWIFRDGKVGRIVAAKKQISRAKGTLLPEFVELEASDDLGRTVKMTGTLVCSCNWYTWANVRMAISLMRWECEGMVTHGDCQEAMWNDYLVYMQDK